MTEPNDHESSPAMTRPNLIAAVALAGALAIPLPAATRRPSAPCGAADREACLYVSDQAYPVGVIDDVVIIDHSRGDLPIPLLIRYPIAGRVEARPVVIWHHGGNPSARGDERSEEWGTTLAAAGYVVIHPARALLADPAPFQAECAANGFTDPASCAYWATQLRLAPQTTHALIDNLDRIEALDPALAGLLDPSRIVVAGHSAGSTAPLAAAGATQQWAAGGPTYDERDDRPIAFLATGVQGPMYAGFNSGFQSPGSVVRVARHSFAGIDRPFLFVTGVGDETGEPPESRVTAWLTSQSAHDKVLAWDTDPEAVHETMDIDKCDTPTRADHCRWIASIGVAFLDAVVRQRPEARAWLASDAARVLTAGAIELHHR